MLSCLLVSSFEHYWLLNNQTNTQTNKQMYTIIILSGLGSHFRTTSTSTSTLLTLKNVSKTWESELARRMMERKVLKPPFRTAGPMLTRDSALRSFRVPEKTAKRKEEKINLHFFEEERCRVSSFPIEAIII